MLFGVSICLPLSLSLYLFLSRCVCFIIIIWSLRVFSALLLERVKTRLFFVVFSPALVCSMFFVKFPLLAATLVWQPVRPVVSQTWLDLEGGGGGVMFGGRLLIMEFTRFVGSETWDGEGKVLNFIDVTLVFFQSTRSSARDFLTRLDY